MDLSSLESNAVASIHPIQQFFNLHPALLHALFHAQSTGKTAQAVIDEYIQTLEESQSGKRNDGGDIEGTRVRLYSSHSFRAMYHIGAYRFPHSHSRSVRQKVQPTNRPRTINPLRRHLQFALLYQPESQIWISRPTPAHPHRPPPIQCQLSNATAPSSTRPQSCSPPPPSMGLKGQRGRCRNILRTRIWNSVPSVDDLPLFSIF